MRERERERDCNAFFCCYCSYSIYHFQVAFTNNDDTNLLQMKVTHTKKKTRKAVIFFCSLLVIWAPYVRFSLIFNLVGPIFFTLTNFFFSCWLFFYNARVIRFLFLFSLMPMRCHLCVYFVSFVFRTAYANGTKRK